MSKKLLMLTICVIFALTALSTTALACSCRKTATVLEEFERAGLVISARLASVDGIGPATMVVEKVYKGDVKAGMALKFGRGDGGNCVLTFDQEPIGQEFLFYLYSPSASSPGTALGNNIQNGAERLYVASMCSRSNWVRSAGDDLAYLDNLKRVQGKTRLSGTFGSWQEEGFNGENIKLTAVGEQKTFTAQTNKDGFFEIYDLPEGTYTVYVEMPFGWKADARPTELISLDFDDYRVNADGTLTKKIPLRIKDGKHTSMNMNFLNDTVIKGKVLSPEGTGMKGVCVKAVQTEPKRGREGWHQGCTNIYGDFMIERMPRGTYRLVANENGQISGDVPFGTVYYPGVTDITEAGIIAVEPGRYVTGKDIQIVQMEETVTFRGRFLYSDGKPVLHESVKFTPESKGSYALSVRSDLEGRFEFRLLKGATGTIQGEIRTFAGEFENCPRLESLIKESGATLFLAKSNVVKVNTLDPQESVDISFPFPSCKKAKQ
jgi:hypothetical protein